MKTVLDEAEKGENHLLTKIYITVELIRTIYKISFKKQGWDHIEISGAPCNYFFF